MASVTKKPAQYAASDIDKEIEEQKKRLAELERRKAEAAEAEACFSELVATMKDANEVMKRVPELLKKITPQKDVNLDREARRAFFAEFEKLDSVMKRLNPDKLPLFVSSGFTTKKPTAKK